MAMQAVQHALSPCCRKSFLCITAYLSATADLHIKNLLRTVFSVTECMCKTAKILRDFNYGALCFSSSRLQHMEANIYILC